jgi:hypothetical protein
MSLLNFKSPTNASRRLFFFTREYQTRMLEKRAKAHLYLQLTTNASPLGFTFRYCFFNFRERGQWQKWKLMKVDVPVGRYGIAQPASQKYMLFVIADIASCARDQPLV